MSEIISMNRYTCREGLLEFARSCHPGAYIRAVGCPTDFLAAVTSARKLNVDRELGNWYAIYGGNLLAALAVTILDDDVIEDLTHLHGAEFERVAVDKVSAALGISEEQRSQFFLRERLSDEFEEKLVAGKITFGDAADVISWLAKTGEVGWEITAPKSKSGVSKAVYDVFALDGPGLSRMQNGFKEANAQRVADEVTRLLAHTEHLFDWQAEPYGYSAKLLVMDAGATDPRWQSTMKPLTQAQALDRVREEVVQIADGRPYPNEFSERARRREEEAADDAYNRLSRIYRGGEAVYSVVSFEGAYGLLTRGWDRDDNLIYIWE